MWWTLPPIPPKQVVREMIDEVTGVEYILVTDSDGKNATRLHKDPQEQMLRIMDQIMRMPFYPRKDD